MARQRLGRVLHIRRLQIRRGRLVSRSGWPPLHAPFRPQITPFFGAKPMTATEVKAALDHAFTDLESLATAVGQGAHVPTLESVKAFLENPLALEAIAVGVSFGLSKIGAATAEPAKAPTA